MLTIKQACRPRPGTFDPARRDTVLDHGDLVEGRIDASEFFSENYITEGMKTLLTEGFRRLEGESSQGVFDALTAILRYLSAMESGPLEARRGSSLSRRRCRGERPCLTPPG